MKVARTGEHDDQILAVAPAAWWREWNHARIGQAHARLHRTGAVVTA